MTPTEVYTIFDATTGKALRRVTCARSCIQSHVTEGEVAHAGRLDMNTTVLNEDGNPVERIRSEEIAERRRTGSLARLLEIERKQSRALREIVLELVKLLPDSAPVRDAIAVLEETDTESRRLRPDMRSE